MTISLFLIAEFTEIMAVVRNPAATLLGIASSSIRIALLYEKSFIF